MIIGDRLYWELEAERVLYIGGRLGGGKTRLAYDIAYHLWSRGGYRVLSNVPDVFGNPYFDGAPPMRNVVILDEGGEYVRTQRLASLLTRSAGKADNFYLFVGKRPPHRLLLQYSTWPVFDFWSNFGLPFILWGAQIEGFRSYKFYFLQAMPSSIHGYYDTLSPSAEPFPLIKHAEGVVEWLAERSGHRAGDTYIPNEEDYRDAYVSQV